MDVDADPGGELELGEDHVRAPGDRDTTRRSRVPRPARRRGGRARSRSCRRRDPRARRGPGLGPQRVAPCVHVEDLAKRAAVDQSVEPEHAGRSSAGECAISVPVPLGCSRHERVRLDRAGGERAVDEDVLVRGERRERSPVPSELGGGKDDRVEILVLQQLVEVARPGGRRAVADARNPRRLVADPAQRRLRQLVERPRERRAETGDAAHHADCDRCSHASLRRWTSA